MTTLSNSKTRRNRKTRKKSVRLFSMSNFENIQSFFAQVSVDIFYIEKEWFLCLALDWSFVGCGRQAPPTTRCAGALGSSSPSQ